MTRRAWIAACLLLVATGCARQQQLVRFSRLQESTTVELCERVAGEGAAPRDEVRAVLDDPQRVQKVVALVNARQDQWQPVGSTPRETRYSIVFRRDGDVTQTFQFADEYLGTRLAEGDARARPLTAAETRRMFEVFQFPANFRTQ